jgi:hypothetical protein
LKDSEKLLHRSDNINGYENTGILFEWKKEKAYLTIDKIRFKGRNGAILYYHNPPVHQIGTTALYAFHEGLDRVMEELEKLDYFILYGPNDPVHSGGDLKESLEKLQRSLRGERETAFKGCRGKRDGQSLQLGRSASSKRNRTL